MDITATMVKQLRDATGAGFKDCREALETTGGDLDRAAGLLREKGVVAAAKKAGRQAREGLIETYSHPGQRVACMVEVNCETDFVAMTEGFKTLAHDLAIQVAATKPRYVRREDIPVDVLEREKDSLRQDARSEGKPEPVVERMVEGRMAKFYQENVLLEQPFIKNEEITVFQLVQDAIAQLRENIVVRRFMRYELGEDLD